jgi:ankyrin repeat protein
MIQQTSYAFLIALILCFFQPCQTVGHDNILQTLGILNKEDQLTLSAQEATSTITELINADDNDSKTNELKKLLYGALVLAIHSNDITTAQVLLDAAVHTYSFDDHDGIKPYNLLYKAASLESLSFEEKQPLCQLLIDQGISIDGLDGEYFTPLMCAIFYENSDAVDTCLRLGANPNVQNPAGETALVIAAQVRDYASIRKLLACQANPNLKDSRGMTPLMYIADTISLKDEPSANSDDELSDEELYDLYMHRGEAEITEALIQAGSHINEQNNKGETPLILACRRHNGGVVDMLMKHLADPFVRDNTQKSATDYAEENDDDFYLHHINQILKQRTSHVTVGARLAIATFLEHLSGKPYSSGQVITLANSIFSNVNNEKYRQVIDAYGNDIIDEIIGTKAPDGISASRWVTCCIDVFRQLEYTAKANQVELFQPIHAYLSPATEYFESSPAQQFCCSLLAKENPELFEAIGATWIDYLVNNTQLFCDNPTIENQHALFAKIISSIREPYKTAFIRHRGTGQLLLAKIELHNLPLIETLIAHGADINARGTHRQTALMQAILRNNLPCMLKLLDLGADVSLIDDSDRTVVDFTLLRQNIPALCYIADRHPHLLNRQSTAQRLTPFVRHLLDYQGMEISTDQEKMLLRIGLILTQRGFDPIIETLYGENTADIAHRMHLEELCKGISSVMYDKDASEDCYLNAGQGLDFLKSLTKNRSVIFMHNLSELKKRLYKYEHTHIRQSVLHEELQKIEAGPQEASPKIDDEAIVDSNQNGSFMTFASYNNLCMNGILHTMPTHATAPAGGMKPARPTLAAYLLELAAKKGRHELTLDDYPVIDPATLEGFQISHAEFKELLDATGVCPTQTILYRFIRSKDDQTSLLAHAPNAAHLTPEAHELFDQQKVNLEAIRKVIETHRTGHAEEPAPKRSKYARPPKKS